MNPKFVLFGPLHLTILALILATGLGLSLLARNHPSSQRIIHYLLTVILSINLIFLPVDAVFHGINPLYSLPLQLSDMTAFAVIITLITRRQWSFELSYYWGFSAAVLAIITPDLKYNVPYIPAIQDFVTHGVSVISVMVFIWGERRKPGPTSWIRAFVITNFYAVLMSFFDFAFKTNYFFLCHKPTERTMLDYFGPWPFYIVTVDIFAFVVFWLLHLPFKSGK